MLKNKLEFLLPSSLESLVDVRAKVRNYLKSNSVSEKEAVQIVFVLDELATNAIEHGYNYENGDVKISLSKDNNKITLTVEDDGGGFNEVKHSKEDGGLGLLIVRKLVDSFEMTKKINGTIFKIEKNLKGVM